MSEIINTNMMSLVAQNNLNTSQSQLATAMQRLSSGLRINSSADDAAGYAIATNMTTQIDGLNTAAQNANDGISLAQTASAALQQITSNLQTIRQLAVESANATNSDSDRAALDSEVQQDLAEITRVSQQTNFNGRNILDGSFGTAAFQVGANVGQTISIDLTQGTEASQIGQAATVSHNVGSLFPGAGLNLANGDLTVAVGTGSAVSVAAGDYTSAAQLASAINTAAGFNVAAASGNEISFTTTTATDGNAALTFAGSQASVLGITGNSVAAGATVGTAQETSANVAAGITASENAVTLGSGELVIGGTAITGTFTDAASLANAINGANITGVTAKDNGSGDLQITNASGAAVTVSGGVATALGLSTSIAANSSSTGTTETAAAYVTANKNAVLLSAGDLTLNGTNVTGAFSDASGLEALLNGAGITGLTASIDSSGNLNLTNTSTTVVTVAGNLAGASALNLPTSAAASTLVTSTGVNAAETASATKVTLSSGQFSIDGTDITGTYDSAQSVADAINAASISGVSAYLDNSGNLAIQSNGAALTIAGTNPLGFTDGTTQAAGSLSSVSVGTIAGANDAINRIDAALATVSGLDSELGAMQNRFSSAVSSAQTVSQNLMASRSRIQDADFAKETAAMSQAQILQQAGVSVLAQANAQPQLVLKLLQ